MGKACSGKQERNGNKSLKTGISPYCTQTTGEHTQECSFSMPLSCLDQKYEEKGLRYCVLVENNPNIKARLMMSVYLVCNSMHLRTSKVSNLFRVWRSFAIKACFFQPSSPLKGKFNQQRNSQNYPAKACLIDSAAYLVVWQMSEKGNAPWNMGWVPLPEPGHSHVWYQNIESNSLEHSPPSASLIYCILPWATMSRELSSFHLMNRLLIIWRTILMIPGFRMDGNCSTATAAWHVLIVYQIAWCIDYEKSGSTVISGDL